MVKSTINTKSRAVLLYVEHVRQANEICVMFGISRRTLTRWVSTYNREGFKH
ncbi:helix-turn-helix domain-containing protein [Candidatus Nitrosotalea okcheonensis]|uniref:helix-turn-helix domain-containing protein n=1 Tax=Candidatus Nitrosotalea okcheonensis TaxID=1903276 RepID=UPI0037430B52